MSKKIFITESQYNDLRTVLSESRTLVDNFDMIGDMINLSDPDKFYFVQLKKRWKDNSDKGMVKKTDGTYHGGAEMGNFQSGTAFKVRSKDELMALKPKIVQLCDQMNARAYISSNPRSESAINNFLPTFLNNQARRNHGRVPQHDRLYGFEHLAGQQKADLANFPDRVRFFFDIDTKDKRIWDATKDILQKYNCPIEKEYSTPSGGLHIVVGDRTQIQDLDGLIDALRVFDGYVNKGRNQTVHANFDGHLILYSNVDTKGY